MIDIWSAQECPARNPDCESRIIGMATTEIRFAMMADMTLAAAQRSVIGRYDLQSFLLPFPFKMVIISPQSQSSGSSSESHTEQMVVCRAWHACGTRQNSAGMSSTPHARCVFRANTAVSTSAREGVWMRSFSAFVVGNTPSSSVGSSLRTFAQSS